MIRTILVDDESNALEVLEFQLKAACPDIDIVAMCTSVDQGIKAIQEHDPELLFLDIEMPVKSGFDLLQSFEDPGFDVIFTTAYNQYAIKAFKFAAFDYLVKPIDTDDLKAVVDRYCKKKSPSIKDQLKLLTDHLKQQQSTVQAPSQATPGRIALPSADGLMILKPEQVVRCESLSNYTKVHLDDGQKVVVSKTLKEVEEILSSFEFYRIHHSHLINLNHVQRYVKTDGGYVLMTDGSNITIARNRKEGFLEQFARI